MEKMTRKTKKNMTPEEIEAHERENFEKGREGSRKWAAKQSLAGRDIGELPPVVDPARKEACRLNFQLFCETYFKPIFTLAWSDDHLKVIAKIERAVLKGGRFAFAMSRGSGKSSLTMVAVLWSLLYGHREFVVLIGASEAAATEMLDTIKMQIEVNGALAEDFPEVAYPIRQIEGIQNRTGGQLYKGERTRITWAANELVLPTIPGSVASGSIVRVAGITGRIRGLQATKDDGRIVRPEFVVIDDPQTNESAHSVEQTRKRLQLLSKDILNLGGPGKKIAGIMPCTVICPGDMAEQILDRKKSPEWKGERFKMMNSFPANKELWKEYATLRADELREKGTFEKATAFYKEHRSEMDEGAEASWAARFNEDEISAIQHAMNLKLTDEAAFQAEYQNEPILEDAGPTDQLKADDIINKLNGLDREIVPESAHHLTMFVDVHKALLYYAVCAWDDDFTGYVVDYGTWPEQRKLKFTLKDAKPSLQDKLPGASFADCLTEGLKGLTEEFLGRVFKHPGGSGVKIERCLIDANWGESTDVVYRFCRDSDFTNILTPSHGKYVGANSTPMSEWHKGRGDIAGFNWRVPDAQNKGDPRHVIFDSNHWKNLISSGLTTALGNRSCISLWGCEADRHRLFADHLTAEYRREVESCGRTVFEWTMRADARDNHWLDCLVGCAVAASMSGVALGGVPGEVYDPNKKEKKIKISEVMEKKRRARLNDMIENHRKYADQAWLYRHQHDPFGNLGYR